MDTADALIREIVKGCARASDSMYLISHNVACFPQDALWEIRGLHDEVQVIEREFDTLLHGDLQRDSRIEMASRLRDRVDRAVHELERIVHTSMG